MYIALDGSELGYKCFLCLQVRDCCLIQIGFIFLVANWMWAVTGILLVTE